MKEHEDMQQSIEIEALKGLVAANAKDMAALTKQMTDVKLLMDGYRALINERIGHREKILKEQAELEKKTLHKGMTIKLAQRHIA